MNPLQLSCRVTAQKPGTRTAVLLDRFNGDADAESFGLLVRQFGPLVLATCRRVLGQSADTDDAFQAVFLTLARRAHSIRDAAALPAWLHRVSLRTARKALARRVPTSPLSENVADPADPFAEVAWKDLRRVLDEELDRLPEKYRGPVVLCWLEGYTQDEAARLQGTSISTLKRRLATGRELLHRRLSRRGLAPTLLAAAVLEPSGLRAVVPLSLREAAVRFADRTASVPTAVSELVVSPLTGGTGRLVLGIAAVAMVATVAVAGVIVQNSHDPHPELTGLPAHSPEAQKPDGLPLPTGVTARFGGVGYRTSDSICASALSPDGKLIALAEYFRVSVYEAATWRPVHVLETSRERGVWVQGGNMAFSRDGKYLGYVRNGASAFVWDMQTGKLANRFDGEAWRWNFFCAFTANGLFTLSEKGRLYFYDPATGREVRSAPAKSRVTAISPDGRYFVRCGEDELTKLTVGDAKTGTDLATLDPFVRGSSAGVAFSRDGKTMTLLPSSGKELQLWDVATRKKVASLPAPEAIYAPGTHWSGSLGGLTDDGSTAWLMLPNRGIARWDIESRKALPRLTADGGPWPVTVHALPDKKILLTPTRPGWVRVWDAETGKEVPVTGRYGYETFMTLAPDGKTVAVGDFSGRIDLLDAATGALTRTVRSEGRPIGRLTFSPDGGRLAVWESWTAPEGRQSRGTVLEVGSGRVVREIEPTDQEEVGQAWVVSFLKEKNLAVVMDRSRQGRVSYLRVVDLSTGAELRRFKSSSDGAVAPDGRTLAYETPGELILADTTTGKELHRVEMDAKEKKRPTILGAYRFAWSANSRLLAVGLPEHVVAIIDLETGRERNRFDVSRGPPDRGNPGPRLLRVFALSPDGKHALVVPDGGSWTAFVWDTTTGKMLAELPHDFQVGGAAFTPDGKAVITHGSGGLGYRWDLDAVIAAAKK